MKKYSLLFLLLTTTTAVCAQQRVVTLDLERAVQLATDSSATADRYRSVYQEARFTWLSWQASRKLQIELQTTPAQYDQYMVQRYLSDENRDIYRQRKTFYANAELNAEQIMEQWGGHFYAKTGLAYLGTFGDVTQDQFATIPVRVGYRQELLGFNPYRWNLQTEPMRLSVAQQTMNYSVEQTAEEAVNRFFLLASAQEQLKMAQENLASCDTIYAIASRRFRIASISKAELSILELQLTNARNTLDNARLERQQAEKSLAAWLGMEQGTQLLLSVPQLLPKVHVSADAAIEQAVQNNPHFLSAQLQELEARREAARLKRRKGINATVDASVGLNQVAERFANAYQSPLVQNQVMLSVVVPISDHGKKRNAWLAAEQKVETATRQRGEVRRDTELDITQTVAEVNERQAIAEHVRQALHIAEEAYSAMLQRFILGQANVNDLSLAQSHWQDARRNQVQALRNFWVSYYHLRTLTLYDYLKRQPVRH